MKTKIKIENIPKESKLTGKLTGIKAFNTNTLSNDFCTKMRKTEAICKECYSAAMLQGVRQNCVKPWERNSKIFSVTMEEEALPIVNAHSFRFHAHGELINYVHLENFMRIAKKNPFTIFALWTKRIGFVRRWLKDNQIDNVIFIYSNPSTKKVMNRPPKGFDKVFNAVYDDSIEEGQTLCTGKSCIDCMACYRNNEHTVIVEKVKKR